MFPCENIKNKIWIIHPGFLQTLFQYRLIGNPIRKQRTIAPICVQKFAPGIIRKKVPRLNRRSVPEAILLCPFFTIRYATHIAIIPNTADKQINGRLTSVVFSPSRRVVTDPTLNMIVNRTGIHAAFGLLHLQCSILLFI